MTLLGSNPFAHIWRCVESTSAVVFVSQHGLGKLIQLLSANLHTTNKHRKQLSFYFEEKKIQNVFAQSKLGKVPRVLLFMVKMAK